MRGEEEEKEGKKVGAEANGLMGVFQAFSIHQADGHPFRVLPAGPLQGYPVTICSSDASRVSHGSVTHSPMVQTACSLVNNRKNFRLLPGDPDSCGFSCVNFGLFQVREPICDPWEPQMPMLTQSTK